MLMKANGSDSVILQCISAYLTQWRSTAQIRKKAKQSKAKQSKAKQSKAKQSKLVQAV
jgi:hypothetical protein